MRKKVQSKWVLLVYDCVYLNNGPVTTDMYITILGRWQLLHGKEESVGNEIEIANHVIFK